MIVRQLVFLELLALSLASPVLADQFRMAADEDREKAPLRIAPRQMMY
jgi:hypothetical protein